jgi:2-keto-4-pentenoate hydratase/2-oxohepta-3-ene-1,7-dioic acid hydratase in catechol pathway
MNFIKSDGKKYYPSKIVCIGRNYVDHIRELGNEIPTEPVFFLKPNSTISAEVNAGDNDDIHYEAELSFMVSAGKLSTVGFGLDLTKREIQSRLKAKGLPWERAKAFDGAAVFSGFVSFNGKTDELQLELYINDHLVQQGGYDLMINKPDEILSEAGKFLSFETGDLIMTGTPEGVGQVRRGDRMTGKIYAKEKLLLEENWTVK